MSLEVGSVAPNFTLLSDAGKEVSLSDFKGKSYISIRKTILRDVPSKQETLRQPWKISQKKAM